MDTSFNVSFAFLKPESVRDYSWVLKHLAASVNGFKRLGVVVINQDFGLVNVLSYVLLNP
jgi:hypothetical protein